jgi:hypothetical protein
LLNCRNELNILDRLPIAVDAAFNSKSREHESHCLHNTRVHELDEINTWANGDSRQRIFWLCGIAGTGKSTIARITADRFFQSGKLGASFFFSRGGKDVGNAEKFFLTISRQLAVGFPPARKHICDAIKKYRDTSELTKRDQWKTFIMGPLAQYTAPTAPSLIIVIDALDEYEGDDNIRLILQLLTKIGDVPSIRLRILLTSRPETPIRLGFRDIKSIFHRDLILHDVPRNIINADISTYFRAQFAKIRDDSEYFDGGWPGETTIDNLIQKADGLFIYAATVCRFINAHKED